MKSLINLGRTRLAQGTAAGFYGLGVQLAFQLVSVPVLTRSWGLAGYGVWVLLYSAPALLAMADLGLSSAGTSAMTSAVAQGDRPRAARIMMALRVIIVTAGLALLGMATVAVLLIYPHALDFGAVLPQNEARLTALALALYGFLALINGVTIAGFVATDAFAKGGFFYQTLILAEAGVALTWAMLGGTQAEVALAFLGMRLIGTAAFSLALRRHAPWLRSADWRIDRDEARTLIRPALAGLGGLGAQAIGVQGSVMAIGAIGGPAAIPAFSVVRTLSRTALQFAIRFNIAAMPRYNVHVSHNDERRANQLLVLNLGVMAVLVIPAALVLLLLGRPFIHLWTGGTVVPSMALVAVMVATMLANAVWGPLSNLILAINRHASFTYFYLAATLACVAVGAMLVKPYGALGMAWALFALEVIMIVQVWLAAGRLGMVSREKLRSGAAGLIAELRHRRSSLDNPDT